MNSFRTTFFLFSLLLGLVTGLSAQKGKVYYDTTQVFQLAKSAVEDLHQGALVIRLSTEYRKLKKLEEMLENGGSSNKGYLKRRIDGILRQRDSLNHALVDLFSRHYDFSALYFLPDTASEAFLDGKREGIFWDANCEPDPSIEMAEESFLISRVGRTEVSNSTGIMAIIFQNSKLVDLDRPFPYFIRLFSLKRQLFSSVENEGIVSQKDLEPRVMRWSEMVKAFYEAVRE